MANFQALPGFRDFYPEDLAVRAYIFGVWREGARRYGFQEYDGPPLEPLELYTEKSGPEIVQQLYNFTDKGGREVALRPEMTPTLARMAGARAAGLRKPIKWFSLPQLFRYERQQRGRLREHFQLNLDIIGEDDVSADAELLAAAVDILRGFGLSEKDFVARVSDRRLLRALLLHAGVPEDRLVVVYNIVDKLERETREALAKRLRDEAGLGADTAGAVLDIFRHKDFEALKTAYFGSADEDGFWIELGDDRGDGDTLGLSFPAELDFEDDGELEIPERSEADVRIMGELVEAVNRMEVYFGHLRAMGLGGFVRFDLSVVRGLAYYTGIVFELFDVAGELRAICGGGRYDNLLKTVSDTDLPALGFGMGDVVLRELLTDRGLLPAVKHALDYYLVAVTPEQRDALLGLAHALRDAGWSVEYALRHQGVGKQFKNASALGARRVVVLGPDEVAEGVAQVKEMETGEERRVPIAELTKAPGSIDRRGRRR